MKYYKKFIFIFACFLCTHLYPADYHVGPGQAYTTINGVPWESMNAGDKVFIHWRTSIEGGPYKEKWVINVAGTSTQPFTVSGVSGPGGELPVIDGNGATTRLQLNYWNEERSVIKVGGSSIPADGTPSYIIIENLEIMSGHKNYSFTDDGGNIQSYVNNAASIHVEKVNNLIIRNCTIHDSGNGIFIGYDSQDITIERNHIYGNGNVGRAFEHNTYTEATNITYKYNRFGPLRSGANGNNLKDRSAGLVVKHNWIEGGNRLLDLVESDFASIINNPEYRKTYVYGNILIEEDGGNSQVLHYGGDSGTTGNYRKGKLYFYNNTLYSIRAGNTTLARLSTNDETADIRNNILFVTASGGSFALLDEEGIISIHNNLMKPSWVNSHQGGGFIGTVTDNGSSVEVLDPGFTNGPAYDFGLLQISNAVGAGTALSVDVLPSHNVVEEYQLHQAVSPRPNDGSMDIGGFEYSSSLASSVWSPLKAQYVDGETKVTWSTASETNSSHFVLMRSNDLSTWVEIKTVPSAGSSHSRKDYNIIDQFPINGKSWYKVLEFDNDDLSSVFGITSISINLDKPINIYPNPASDFLFFEKKKNTPLKKLHVYDTHGRRLIKSSENIDFIDISNLNSGIYYIILEFENGSQSMLFTKL